jgi:hypothetical protein
MDKYQFQAGECEKGEISIFWVGRYKNEFLETESSKVLELSSTHLQVAELKQKI